MPVSATGDFAGNLERLKDELKRARFDGELGLDLLAAGDPVGVLPLLHFALLRFSKNVARWLVERGYDLYGKTDLRFIETVYRLVRHEFGYRHALTCKQFLSVGFAERKLLFVVDLLQLCRAKHLELGRELSATRKVPPVTQKADRATLPGASRAAVGNCASMTIGPQQHAPPQQPMVQRHLPPGYRLRGETGPPVQRGVEPVAFSAAHEMARAVESTGSSAVPVDEALNASASDCPLPAAPPPQPYPSTQVEAVEEDAEGLDDDANDDAEEEENDEDDGHGCFLTQVPIEQDAAAQLPAPPPRPRCAWSVTPSEKASTVLPAASLRTTVLPPAFQVSAPAVAPPAPEEMARPVVVAPSRPQCGAVGVSATPQEEPLSILPIPVLPASTVPHRPAPALPEGSRLSFAAPGAAAVPPQKPLATDAAAKSEVAALRQEVTELRRLLTHACAQIDALSADRAASSAQLDARLTLIEGQVKLMHAATPPAPTPAPNPAVAPAPPEAEPSEPAPAAATDGIDAPRGVSRAPLGSLREAPQPRCAADGGPSFGMPPKLTATTYKSSFAEYVSTQEFISDMSRRFASTQKLLLESPTDFATTAGGEARK